LSVECAGFDSASATARAIARPEILRGVPILVSHDERHDRTPCMRLGKKRQLHFEGVLAQVRGRALGNGAESAP
jgi:hypothetical protein